jgi:acyl dehydratase
VTLQASELQVGDEHTEVVVDDLTRTQIVQYSGASGDYNPLHSDEIFATQVAGFPGIFAHGMLTMGLTGKMVTNYVGDGRLRSFGGRFRAQVWPGDTLTAKAEVVGIRNDENEVGVIELRITTTNQDGVEVFAGHATATID